MPSNSSIYVKIVVFTGILVLNFGALAIGSLLMGGSPASNEWYISLDKAPWTPPGWVFGFAWTFIMICFTFYIYTVFKVKKSLNLTLTLFILQWFLNILWNPLFFNLHLPVLALLILLLLLITLLVLLVYSEFKLQFQLLILPYVIWLGIAISLNFYIIVNN